MLISFSLVALSNTQNFAAHDVKATWQFAVRELGYRELVHNNFSEYSSCKVLALSKLKYPPKTQNVDFGIYLSFLGCWKIESKIKF